MKFLYQIIFVAACVGCIVCQSINDIDVDDAKKKIGEIIPGVDEIDTSKFNTSKLPSEEDVEKVLREKCKKNGAEDAVELLKEQQDVVKTCVESHVNYTQIQEELDEAKKSGSMDEVFGRYCNKWPTIYACFDTVIKTARSCMDDKEEVGFNKSLDIVTELQEFMCFKDGDRLAMFVAEDGVECMSEQKDGIQECLNSTLGGRIPDSDDFSVSNLPSFLFTAKDCNDFDTIRVCVNKELEKCKNTTPANIVDAFFKFLKKHMPCTAEAKMVVSNPNTGSSSINLLASGFIVFTTLLSFRVL